jgi:hypothetical protein
MKPTLMKPTPRRQVLERDSSGFTVRVETEERSLVLCDGGEHDSLEAFLAAPATRAWLAENAATFPTPPATSTFEEP